MLPYPGSEPCTISTIIAEIRMMRHKIFALILALTVASWAQTATQTTPSPSEPGNAPAEKAKPSCCDKMAGQDGGMSCARHAKNAGENKEMASCCAGKDKMSCCGGGKDAKSCMNGDKAGSCCKDCGKDKTAANCCGKDCHKNCCASDKKETARKCCGHELHS